MPEFSLVILYVDSPAASAAFYRSLLDREPMEQSPTFAMFKLGEGAALGVWSRHTVEPPPAAMAGSSEVVFLADDVDQVHADWATRGLPILQAPIDLDFGRTFVALDPDGHRLRVFKPAFA